MHHRIKELQRSFRLRLLICHIDVEDVVEPLAQVIKAALLNEVTLICGWSPEVILLVCTIVTSFQRCCTHYMLLLLCEHCLTTNGMLDACFKTQFCWQQEHLVQ